MLNRLGVLLRQGATGFSLAFIGPPGVGKTTIARIIAKIFNRPMQEIQGESLRGIGHLTGDRNVYRNSGPGLLAQSFLNSEGPPVILIDEYGKVSPELQATLSSALDRKKNNIFLDSFLGQDAPIDLSEVIFILIANHGERLNESVIDRANVVYFSPLTQENKKAILAKKWAEQKIASSLPENLTMTAGAIDVILEKNRDIPGARRMEQDIVFLCDWLHTRKLNGNLPAKINNVIAKRFIEKTWVDMHNWEEGKGFIADITLGSVGLQKTTCIAEATFEAIERKWYVCVKNNDVTLRMLSGAPIQGHHGFNIRASNNLEIRFATRFAQLYNDTRNIVGSFEPLLPQPDTEEFKEILDHDGVSLKMRLVFTTEVHVIHEVDPLLKKGMSKVGLLATSIFDIP